MEESIMSSKLDQAEGEVDVEETKHRSEEPRARWSQEMVIHGEKVMVKGEPPR
jgi:hypothetical protein